jgi:hypothetical protein
MNDENTIEGTADNVSYGEVVGQSPMEGYALDGRAIPATSLTAGQFLDVLEEGNFSADLYKEITDLAAAMNDIGERTGQKVKGQIQITLDLTKEDSAFRVASKFKVKKPEDPRPRSIVWTDEHNRFTRFPPNQGQFFGVRRADGGGAIRRA